MHHAFFLLCDPRSKVAYVGSSLVNSSLIEGPEVTRSMEDVERVSPMAEKRNQTENQTEKELLPVTVVSGFRGVGKTSLIDHLRASAKGSRLHVLEDDGERDLIIEIEKLAKADACDHVLLDCSAAEEPFFIAEYLIYGDQRSPPPESLRIDAMVTVVDASTFLRDCLESEELTELGLAADEEDDRLATEVLVEQVEFADILVVNKTDLVPAEHLSRLEALLTRLNPHAKILFASHGRVPSREILGTGFFEFDSTEFGAGWLAELDGEFEGIGELHGVSSFTVLERRPLHPIRFNEFLSDLDFDGLIRAKGRIWVASRHNEVGVWSLAGLASVLTYGGPWYAATPARDWPAEEAERALIMEEWVPPFGDRRQEIAFIGVSMNESEIRERLSECLLTPEEMKGGPEAWQNLMDPLPDWHDETDSEALGGGADTSWT